MKLIEECKKEIENGADEYLAMCLASACNGDAYPVSILRVGARLPENHIKLVARLLSICREPDFSNSDQDDTLQWLRDGYHIPPF